MGLRQGTAGHGKVLERGTAAASREALNSTRPIPLLLVAYLTEQEAFTAIDESMTSDNAIARHADISHAKILAALLLQLIPFAEASLVNQQLNALTSSQFAFRVLKRNDSAVALAGAGW